MSEITFPLYQVSLSKTRLKTNPESVEFLFLEDCYYLSKEDSWFRDYIQYQKFMDMRGKVYYIVDKVPVKAWYSFFWRRHCYEYVFQASEEVWDFEHFQRDLLEKISVLEENEILFAWKAQIQKAKDFEDCIG